MRRFMVAAVLALVLGSQADAQIFRRYAAPAYYYPSSNVEGINYTTPAYYTPGVVTAGYYTTPSGWMGYTPSYYSGSYYYPGYTYTNTYAYPRYYGRRWGRW